MSVSEVPASLRTWMAAVSEIARAVNASESLDAVLARVAERACELIGFEFCSVMLADPQQHHLDVIGCYGLTPDYPAQVSATGSLLIHPAGRHLDTPAAQAYREGRTVAVRDAWEAPRYGKLRDLATSQGYHALLAVPLRGSGDLAGVVVAYSAAVREFTGPELELVELLAEQAALALENARLRTAQQDVIAELSAANEELRRGRAVLDWAEQQHHRLMRLVLDEVGLPGLVEALATTLDASVTVEDAEMRVLARAPAEGYCPPPHAAVRRRASTRAALEAQESPGSYEAVRVPVFRANGPSVTGPSTQEFAWAAPVVLGRELAGRLWITALPAAPEPVQLRVVERFALVVALELLRQRHLADFQDRLSIDLLSDLLRAGGPTRPQDVLDRAAALGHDLSRPHAVAVLAVNGPVPPAVRLPELGAAAVEPSQAPLTGHFDGLHVLLLPADHDPGTALRRILTHAEQSLGPDAVPTLIVGPVATGLADYAPAFRVAKGAVLLRGTSQGGGLVDVGELGLSALLLETGPPEAMRRFSRELLQPICTQDARRGGDLLETLRTWLASGCSTAAAAEVLVVHANTIGYRLGQVERLTGRSLRDQETRLALQLALTVHDIAELDLHG